MSKSIAVVTGAPGWLGSRFVRCALAGMPEVDGLKEPMFEEIHALKLKGVNDSELRDSAGRIKVIEGALQDPASLKRLFADAIDATVFHMAGIIHPTRGIKQLYEVNTQGTVNMLDAAINAGARRFIFVSSNSPVGTNPNGALLDEQSSCRPYMHYGKSKKLAEDAVNQAGQSGRIETVILRPCWFYGPNQPDRQTLFFKMVKNGKFPLVGSGHNLRSMSYIDNLCQGLLLAAQHNQAAGNTYWIADRNPYSMNDILSTIQRLMETEFALATTPQKLRLPDVVSDVAYVADAAAQSLGVYHQKIHVLSELNKNIACSVARAESELGYKPQVDLEEGMRRSIQWMLDSGIRID